MAIIQLFWFFGRRQKSFRALYGAIVGIGEISGAPEANYFGQHPLLYELEKAKCHITAKYPFDPSKSNLPDSLGGIVCAE